MSNKSYLSVYAKSFSWAGFFLPKETFKKCSTLYDFCRIVDDIADNDEKIEIKKAEVQTALFKKEIKWIKEWNLKVKEEQCQKS